jgi:hypothetical protein
MAHIAVVALLLGTSASCPDRAPCNCSPGDGLLAFEAICAAHAPGGVAECADALIRAGINVTRLAQQRTRCSSSFKICRARDAASCIKVPPYGVAFCTGKCHADAWAVATLTSLLSFCLFASLLIVILGAVIHRLQTRNTRAARYHALVNAEL